jgi:hypothetical protein
MKISLSIREVPGVDAIAAVPELSTLVLMAIGGDVDLAARQPGGVADSSAYVGRR